MLPLVLDVIVDWPKVTVIDAESRITVLPARVGEFRPTAVYPMDARPFDPSYQLLHAHPGRDFHQQMDMVVATPTSDQFGVVVQQDPAD